MSKKDTASIKNSLLLALKQVSYQLKVYGEVEMPTDEDEMKLGSDLQDVEQGQKIKAHPLLASSPYFSGLSEVNVLPNLSKRAKENYLRQKLEYQYKYAMKLAKKKELKLTR